MGGATLPVSMDDVELFPRKRNVVITHAHAVVEKANGAKDSVDTAQSSVIVDGKDMTADMDTLAEMRAQLSPLWWSRLLIACRGYISSFYSSDSSNEDTLFCFDDSFIYLHKQLVEADPTDTIQCYKDLIALASIALERMAELAAGYAVNERTHPFYMETTRGAFRRLFGQAGPHTYYRAYKQSVAYMCFYEVLQTLLRRWAAQNTGTAKRKGVRFVEDPEWEPDDRVVVFRQFYSGNRTWVLLDFDRHILMHYRPTGVRVIFGDRYVQCRIDDGHKLCAHCGMMEQMPNQFPVCPQCTKERRGAQSAAYCSSECLNTHIGEHAARMHSNTI